MRPLPVVRAIAAVRSHLAASRRERVLTTIALATLMFVGMYTLLVAMDVPSDSQGDLFLIPIALVAVVVGRTAGLIAGGVGMLLFILAHDAAGYDLTASTIGSRAAVFALLGGGLGHFVERARHRGGEVQRAEEGYRDLLGRLPAIVYTSEYGADGKWSYVSPGIETILGYSVSEWLADPGLWYALIHPDDRAQALVAEQRSHLTGEPLYSEYRLIARDGRVVWFRDEATVIHNEAGSPTLLAGVMLDVTTHRRAQDELELGYVVQRKLAEAASLNEGLRGVLGALGARFGWDACAFWAIDGRECALRLGEMWHAAPSATEAIERTSRSLRFREGEGLPGRVWATGDPVWLEEQQGRFQAVLDAAPAPVYAKDTEGRYLFVNRRFEDVVGIPAEEAVGRTDHDLMPAESAAAVRASDARVLSTGGQIEVEEELTFGDVPHWYLSVKFPLRDGAGGLYAVCGISSEITELKRAQQQLSQREEAERATRAKTEFLSRVSHELRTPLNAILGFGQLLEVEPLSERQHASVEQIMQAGRHLTELVDELLEISRIESGEFKVLLRPVDVATGVQDILHLLQPLAAEQQVRISNALPAGCPWALADEQRTKQVLLNLLSNAIKYNRRGGEVDVAVSASEDEGIVAVRITDTGRGIAPQHLERLFNPFDRLGAEQSTIKGTGLGLALSKLMAEAMSGRLLVESEVGVGSTFVFELPVASSVGERERYAGKALSAAGRSEP